MGGIVIVGKNTVFGIISNTGHGTKTFFFLNNTYK